MSRATHSHCALPQLALLRRGDFFIWIGLNERFRQPWQKLRERGVKRVYYQTEPESEWPMRRGLPTCFYSTEKVDELWDFSWQNIERCAPFRTKQPVLRLVRPGYMAELASAVAASENAAPAVAASENAVGSGASPLLFFGNKGAGRARCFAEIQQLVGTDNVSATFAVWEEGELVRLLRGGRTFLNLHKRCLPSGPATFRFAPILSAGKPLISMRVHPRDEAAYEGLVSFANDSAGVAAAYLALMSSNNWAADESARRARFAASFSPRVIFESAGVYRDWKLDLAAGNQ